MSRNKNGAILITALWILTILSILALGIGFRVSLEARLARYNMDRMKALYLARAGVVKTAYRISKTPTGCDTIYECGIALSPEERGDTAKRDAIFKGSLGEGSFAVGYVEGGKNYPGVSDEERKININTADDKMLFNLFSSVEIAASILAWRSNAASASSSSDDAYYGGLPHPYERKKANFNCIEELMLVRGITPALFNSVKDYITISGDKININTASDKVLLSLGLTPNIVDQMIRYRNGPDGISGTKDDIPFTSIDIETILPGQITEQENGIIASLKKFFTTTSSYFRIESKGTVARSKVEKTVIYIVKKEPSKGQTSISYREY